MKYIKIFCLFTLCFLATVSAVAKEPDLTYNYEVTRDGMPLSNDPTRAIFMVYSYGKKSSITSDIGKRNAVHAIIFKGLQGADKCGPIPALIGKGSYDQNKEYFDNFFKSGDYMQYVDETNKGFQDVIKISSKEYKVGIKVKVNVKALRDRLTKDKVITDYRSAFMN